MLVMDEPQRMTGCPVKPSLYIYYNRLGMTIYILCTMLTLVNSEKSLAIKKGPSDIPLLAARHEKNVV
jgi:hypothetical protein